MKKKITEFDMNMFEKLFFSLDKKERSTDDGDFK